MQTEKLLHKTVSLCLHCQNSVPAEVVSIPNNEVWMHKYCLEHGQQSTRLSTDSEWYQRTRLEFKPLLKKPASKKEINLGCPYDCGTCDSHEASVKLPVVTINSSCNLDCPICYVHNKNDDPYLMDLNEFKKAVQALKAEYKDLDILNLTGGEPTLHPQFLEFLDYAKSEGIHRVTICTNGIRFVKDPTLLEKMAKIGARVALSFDSYEEKADYQLQGAKLLKLKLQCLDLLEKYQVNTTLIPVMTKGVNDHEIGAMIETLFQRSNIRHLEVHTMTYTGQSGKSFDRSGRITMNEVLQQIEKTTKGFLKPQDFVPSPCAHPLCYQIAYFLMDPTGGRPIPFTRFLSAGELYTALADRLYLEPTPYFETAIKEAINRLWVEDSEESQKTMGLLKQFLQDLFPTDKSMNHFESMAIGEKWVKAVYIHSHMDEENFDMERDAQCCDSNCYSDGSKIPVCNYNVLYRNKEKLFNVQPQTWNERLGGVKEFKNDHRIAEG